ncbi:MAG: hypothetical protein ACI9JZ_002056, partial [Lentimonas sp.]
ANIPIIVTNMTIYNTVKATLFESFTEGFATKW